MSAALKPSRRHVLVQTLSAGFALAVRPVAASTVTTDDTGLDAGPVEIPVPPGNLPGYRALPKNPKGRLPVILVVQEIFGLHEHIQDVCRRLAKQGYYAIATELFYRQGDVSRLTEMKAIQEIVARVPDAQVRADLDATLDFVKKDARAETGRTGVTGFCWGGRSTWLYAAHNPSLKAAVAWYGRLDGERNELRPKFPIDLVDDLKTDVLGLYGGKDQSIPVAQVDKMKTALAASKNPHARASRFHVYADAGHAFNSDYRPSYHEASAKDGWKRMLAWFKQHGL